MSYGEFRLFNNGTDTIGARSLEEARKFYVEAYCHPEDEPDDLVEVAPDKVITIHDVDRCEDWPEEKKAQTAAAWASECTEPCLVASTEY